MANVRRYADEDERPEGAPDDERAEGEPSEADPSEADPGDEQSEGDPPQDDSQEGQPGGMGGEPDGEAPPEGFDGWMKAFQYACKYDPTLYGMAMKYAEDMAAQGEPQQGELPPEGDPNAQAEGDPTGDPTAEGDPGDEQGPTPEEIADVLAGGAGEMPPPEGDEQNTTGDQPYSGFGKTAGELTGANSFRDARRTGMGAALGGLAGAGAGALMGSPGAGAAIGAGLGGGAGLMTSQNDQVPVAYQAAFAKQERRLAAIEKNLGAKDQEIANLKAVNARKDSEFVVYQLMGEGYTALSTPEQAEQMVQFLASLPESQRALKVREIRANYHKDASLAYQAQGAPVGGWLPVTQERVESPKSSVFDEAKQAKALRYMRSDPKELRGLSAEDRWAKCVEYAMNEQVVTG